MKAIVFLLALILELWSLIEASSRFGVGRTFLLLSLSAVAGALLIRAQGAGLLQRLPKALARGETIESEILGSFAKVIAGILLIIPGFFTDLIALTLIFPPTRYMYLRKFTIQKPTESPTAQNGSRILDGESRRLGE
jgi:UPF0716 protein FxsA